MDVSVSFGLAGFRFDFPVCARTYPLVVDAMMVVVVVVYNVMMMMMVVDGRAFACLWAVR